MIITELADKLELTVFNMADEAREISSGYCGDLLSWVMGRAPMDSVWITIMSNRNLVAVAEMADVACIVLSEGVVPDNDMLDRAKTEGINVLGSGLGSFELSAKIYDLLNN